MSIKQIGRFGRFVPTNRCPEESESSLCKYGTALTPYEADEIPSKKPLQIEDQIVKDENGRRRFHGAFTGGFSAGYWNTVGSKEGFTPSEFKSSRGQKAIFASRSAADFMDEEDLGEFGIAPQKIQTKDDFATGSGKRKFERPSDGPIPGEPVLKNLLKPSHDKAAARILISMGWRQNQGVGSRLTYREKKRTNERNQRELYIQEKYGCDDAGPSKQTENESEDEILSDEEELTFAPDDFDPFIANIKTNIFGLGYTGLQSTFSKPKNVNLFESSLQLVDKSNRKITISGQAFGVGAMEEEDDDIYARDDMSQYDRSLTNEEPKKERKMIKSSQNVQSMIEGFTKTSISDSSVKTFSVDISRNFVARNWLKRRTRFDPLDAEKSKQLENTQQKVLGLGRHDLKPEERGNLLGETSTEKPKEIAKIEKSNEEIENEMRQKNLEAAKKISELLNTNKFVTENNEEFKPFASNPDKQSRYEKFLTLKSSKTEEIEKLMKDIQPLSMSSFEREMEKKEFIQAKKMYQPLDSMMASRFVKECDLVKEKNQKEKEKSKKFQRTRVMWKPHKDLCKRFNIPEPFGGMMVDLEEEKEKKRKQGKSLFDFIGVPVNTKANFVTPQVIPKNVEKIEKPKIAPEKPKLTLKEIVEDIKPIEMKLPEPKTDLERQVVESIDKKPEEKKELFKAIFCDSDEDEDDEETQENQPKPAATLSEASKSKFIESFIDSKPSSEINILRNEEAPQGIFKNIFGISRANSSKTEEISDRISPSTEQKDEFYGPLPPAPSSSTTHDVSSSSSSDSELDEKILKKLKKIKHKKDKKSKKKKSKKEEAEVWVEKKHKKHKKHKSRK